jgi:chromosome segregation ATPase
MVSTRKSAVPSPATALEQLQQARSLKILTIAETLAPKDLPQSSKKRNSAASVDSDQNGDTHPAALEADLLHYKVSGVVRIQWAILTCKQELFSKLRFSYVEQVTKEKFLRNITENPPRLVEATENHEKETEILALKASLKERKLEVADILKQLEDKGKELTARYEGLQLRTEQLESLPTEIEGLEASIEQLKQNQAPTSTNPELALPLPETLRLLTEREAELAALNAQILQLQTSLPNRARELEKLERELRPLETQKQGTVAAAKEARRRKEEGGGIGDELEERGRWLTAAEKMLRESLEVDGR